MSDLCCQRQLTFFALIRLKRANTMLIYFNQQPFSLTPPCTVAEFLAGQQQLRPGIAVAINQQVIPRSCWDTQPLNNGDTIMLFTAIAGG